MEPRCYLLTPAPHLLPPTGRSSSGSRTASSATSTSTTHQTTTGGANSYTSSTNGGAALAGAGGVAGTAGLAASHGNSIGSSATGTPKTGTGASTGAGTGADSLVKGSLVSQTMTGSASYGKMTDKDSDYTSGREWHACDVLAYDDACSMHTGLMQACCGV